MATRKKNSKKTAALQAPIIPEEEAFTSAATFDFSTVASPRVTRARRASVSYPRTANTSKEISLATAAKQLNNKAKPASKKRNAGPTVTAKKGPVTAKKTAKKAATKAGVEEEVEEFIFDPTPSRGVTPSKNKVPGTPSKGINTGSFYSSPTKIVKGILANPLAASSAPNKACVQPSPTKKYSKSMNKVLMDQEIENSLMKTSTPKTPSKVTVMKTSTPKKPNTLLPISPNKKISKMTNRTLTEKDIEASLMDDFETPETNVPLKTFETEIPSDKIKPRRKEVDVKSPLVKAFKAKTSGKPSRIPMKSPPKTPLKGLFVPRILPVGSPIITSIMKEIKKVEIKLTPLRIKEDPNVIFHLLESEHDNKDRVQSVVKTLVDRYNERKIKTRRSFGEEDEVDMSLSTKSKKVNMEKPTLTQSTVTPVAEVGNVLEPGVVEVVKVPKAKTGRSRKEKTSSTPKIADDSKVISKPKVEKTSKIKTVDKFTSEVNIKTCVAETINTSKAKVSSTTQTNVLESPGITKVGKTTKVSTDKGAEVKVEKTPKGKIRTTSKAKGDNTPKLQVENDPQVKVENTTKAKVEKTTKGKVEKTPKAEVKKMPKSKVEKTPKAEVEETPENNVEKTPKAEVEKTPKAKVEKTPKAKVEKTPKAKVEKTPKAKVEKTIKANDEKTPKAKVEKMAKAIDEKTPKAKVEKMAKAKDEKTPKTKVEKTPRAKVEKTPKAKVEKTPKAKVEKTPKAKVEKTPKAKVEKTPKAKVEKTPKVKVEKTPKAMVEKTPIHEVKGTEAKIERQNFSPPVANRGIKRSHETTHTASAGPSSKRFKIEDPSPKVRSVKKSPKVTPVMAIYKPKATQNQALSALKKPLKRLSKAVAVTPVQVRPFDLLKRNLKQHVDTAITAKVEARPDSSPYSMEMTENNSPVFRKVEQEVKTLKQHLSGTPARIKPSRTRKFGTTIQPCDQDGWESSALADSKRRSVSSSTPLRSVCQPAAHPLEAVEATPIMAPTLEAEAVSPQPMMVTGGLAKMCAIM